MLPLRDTPVLATLFLAESFSLETGGTERSLVSVVPDENEPPPFMADIPFEE